jgi:cytosine/adenosine deaminase-related metal-dependent hydrolase
MDLAAIAFRNNGALASEFFPGLLIGKLVPGAAADLIFVDYEPNTPLTLENLPWHIVFGFQPGMVTSTMVAGKMLMKDRQLLTLDAAEIAQKARQIAPRVWERYRANVAALH